jgi:DNA-binding NtrC family response regulator
MTSACELPEDAVRQDGRFERAVPLAARPRSGALHCPSALVAASDEKMLQQVAETVVRCGLAAFLSVTVDESRRILRRQEPCLVVCGEHLKDGRYEDILRETLRWLLRTPVIVVSATGDWPDYLKAISAGAFDYLAYPPIPGDLSRSIRSALSFRATRGDRDTATKFSSSSKGEMR